jgi:DNA polymerase IIIc chi subunit
MQIGINFYKLFSGVEKIPAISLICSKIMEVEEKVAIFLEHDDEMKQLDEKLWIFSQSEFLPHLTENSEEFDEFKEETPILLTTKKENIIEAENLMIFKKPENYEFFQNYKKIFFLFTPEVEAELLNARAFWKEVSSQKEAFFCKFYEQSSDKKWKLKV